MSDPVQEPKKSGDETVEETKKVELETKKEETAKIDKKVDDEPKIEDEITAPKRTTLLYKIDPMVPYFPACKTASKDTLISIKTLYNKF